jgi:hypothetical protein
MHNRYSDVHRCKDASQNRIFSTAIGLVPVTTTTPHKAMMNGPEEKPNYF